MKKLLWHWAKNIVTGVDIEVQCHVESLTTHNPIVSFNYFFISIFIYWFIYGFCVIVMYRTVKRSRKVEDKRGGMLCAMGAFQLYVMSTFLHFSHIRIRLVSNRWSESGVSVSAAPSLWSPETDEHSSEMTGSGMSLCCLFCCAGTPFTEQLHISHTPVSECCSGPGVSHLWGHTHSYTETQWLLSDRFWMYCAQQIIQKWPKKNLGKGWKKSKCVCVFNVPVELSVSVCPT